MNNVKHLISYFTLISFIFVAGCTKNTTEIQDVFAAPGEFNLTWFKGLRKIPTQYTNDLQSISDIEFDLGDLDGTRDSYFLLTNKGENVIKDIQLSVTDSSFLIYPEKIDSLVSQDKIDFSNLSEYPILRLTAKHGFALNQIDPNSLMDAGINSTVLSITGKTLEEESAKNLSLDAQMSVNALLMNLAIFDGANELDLLQSNGRILVGGFIIPDFVKYYYVSDTVSIKNIGNVPVDIKIFSDDTLLALNEGEEYILEDQTNTHIMFDGRGMPRDRSRFPAYSDGNTYVFLRWQ